MPREIAAFFESYRSAFNALDGAAVAELYAVPSGIAQGGTYTHWSEREPIRQNMDALCDMYRQKGYVRAEFAPNSFIPQGGEYAIADLRWSIYWDNGQEPWQFSTSYNLVRTGQAGGCFFVRRTPRTSS